MGISTRRQAFSLVELSIVIAIIGLLVGGVILAKVMRTQQELKNIGVSATSYMVAFRQFQQTYGYIPGDFPTATEIWGRADGGSPVTNNCGAPNTTVSTNKATCNGDGDGFLTWYTGGPAAPPSHEAFRAWQHLAAAGLIAGTYNGVATTSAFIIGYTSALSTIPGVKYRAGIGFTATGGTFPPGPFPRTAFSWLAGPAMVDNTASADAVFYDGDYTNALMFGTPDVYSPDYPMTATAQALTPEQAYLLDQKRDDGMPATGNVRTYKGNSYNGAQNACSTSAASSAAYNLSNTNNVCTMIFMTSQLATAP